MAKKDPAKGQPSDEPTGESEKQLPEIKSEIEREIGPLLPGGTREQVVNRIVTLVQQESFKGPLPHPRHLEAYERTCPGSADRIMAMAEKALDHNIEASKQEQSDDAADGGWACGWDLPRLPAWSQQRRCVVLPAIPHWPLCF